MFVKPRELIDGPWGEWQQYNFSNRRLCFCVSRFPFFELRQEDRELEKYVARCLMKNIRAAFDSCQHIIHICKLLYVSLTILKCNLKIRHEKILIRVDLNLEGSTRSSAENAIMKILKTKLFLVHGSQRTNFYRKKLPSENQHVLQCPDTPVTSNWLLSCLQICLHICKRIF